MMQTQPQPTAASCSNRNADLMHPRNMTSHRYLSKDQRERLGHVEEELIPIRLELDFEDGSRFRDVFMWNVNDASVTPEHFSDILCHDLEFGPEYVPTLSESIHAQLEEHRKVRNIVRSTKAKHVPIEISLPVGDHILQDRLIWDMSEDVISPESFATQMAAELGLGREHALIIAHSIREQLYRHHLEHRKDEHYELRSTTDVVRQLMMAAQWEPAFYRMNEDAIDSLLRNQEREARYVKRVLWCF
jgi:hypothetical protein